jgi:predicted small lipoprotein YifL
MKAESVVMRASIPDRHRARFARGATFTPTMVTLPPGGLRRLVVLAAALALAACGVKGPLVPVKRTPDAEAPPQATTVPEIPEATPPAHPTPAP